MSVCRTCKSSLHHAHKRIKAEGLLVDTAGGSWWVWTPKGEVLVIGRNTYFLAVLALGRGELAEDEISEEIDA